MSVEEILSDLLLKWEELEERGEAANVEVLCHQYPELAGELQRRIDALRTLRPFLSTPHSRESLEEVSLYPDSNSVVERLGSLRPGDEPIPGHRLVEPIGAGGFGAVWKAIASGGIEVALKFVPLQGQAGAAELHALETIKNIRHPHLLSMFGIWQKDSQLIIAMELADATLWEWFQGAQSRGHTGIPPADLIEALGQAGQGIDYLNEPRHALPDKDGVGIQHRDIKPQNILVVGNGVKVADFGLVRFLESSIASHSGSMTPAYAAPEFFHGETSNRSDQYCLAVTYCHLRGGRLPFTGTHAQILAGHLTGDPDLSMLSPPEQPVVARALAKIPAERWATCSEFVHELSRSLNLSIEPNTNSAKRMRSWKWLVSALGLTSVIVLFWLLSQALVQGTGRQPDAPKQMPETAGAHFSASNGTDDLAPSQNPTDSSQDLVTPEQSPASRSEERSQAIRVQSPTTEQSLTIFPLDPIELQAGRADAVRLAVQRQGCSGPVQLSLEQTPEDLEVAADSIPADSSTVNLRLAAASTARPGTHTLQMRASLRDVSATFHIEVSVRHSVGEVRRFVGHTGGVRTVLFDATRRRVVSGGDDKAVVVWDLESAQAVKQLRGHAAPINELDLSPNGDLLLSASQDKTIRLWDLNTGAEIRKYAGHTDGVTSVAFLPHGNEFLSTSDDGAIIVWDLHSGGEARRFNTSGQPVWCLAVDNRGERAITGGESGRGQLWDVKSGNELKRFDVSADPVFALQFTHEGDFVVAGCGSNEGQKDFTAKLLRIHGAASKRSLVGHTGAVGAAAFSRDSSRVVTGSVDRTVRLWNVETTDELHSFRHDDAVYCVVILPGGRHALSSSRDTTVRLWGLPE